MMRRQLRQQQQQRTKVIVLNEINASRLNFGGVFFVKCSFLINRFFKGIEFNKSIIRVCE